MFPKQNPIIKVKIEKETNCVYVYKSIIIIKNFKNYLLFKPLCLHYFKLFEINQNV